MLNYYHMTGYRPAYDSAIEIAENTLWRLKNDSQFGDVNKNGGGYFYSGFDGSSGSDIQDGREGANAFLILLAAYEATGEVRWREGLDLLADDFLKTFNGGNQFSGNFLTCPCKGSPYQTVPWRTLYAYDHYKAVANYLVTRLDFIRDHMLHLDTPQKGMATFADYWKWSDGSKGSPNYSNWTLVIADVYASMSNLGITDTYKDLAAALFNHGSYYWNGKEWAPIYSSVKEATLSASYGGETMWMIGK